MKSITILIASQGKNAELGNKIKQVAEKSFKCELIDLIDLRLPMYSESEEEKGIPEKAEKLSKKLVESDSLIFIAPEYNGSIPPSLNNAICWISRSGKNWREAFNGKTTLNFSLPVTVAIANSLPQRSPTNTHVVDIGISLSSLKKNNMIQYTASMIVALLT